MNIIGLRHGQPGVTRGPGQTHHYALAVADESSLEYWLAMLLASRVPASPIEDHEYFKSFLKAGPDRRG